MTRLVPKSNKVLITMSFDYGKRTIGIAIGQSITHTTTPLPHIEARANKPDWVALAQLIHEWKPRMLVIGLPLNMDGSSSDMARSAKKFARQLLHRFNIPCAMADERLSSYEARLINNASYKKNAQHSKASIHSISACLILQLWFGLNTDAQIKAQLSINNTNKQEYN